MAARRSKSTAISYDAADLQDAPEHHEYSRAMGVLTWGTWDHGVRPVEQRIKDFLAAYPPAEPVRHSGGGSLQKQSDGTYAPGSLETRTRRFLSKDWRSASLHELLSRYGLRLAGGPARQERTFTPSAFRDTARKRNIRLRVLHGGVDIEPVDMDAAKAEFLDLQERKRAAQETRDAIRRMKAELDENDPGSR
jgi:hypothetical protein